MEYQEEIMRMTQLVKKGFSRDMLMRAFRTRGQTFAWKINPLATNSPIEFYTPGFEKWRLQQIKLSQKVG